jgi:hypothetical protein
MSLYHTISWINQSWFGSSDELDLWVHQSALPEGFVDNCVCKIVTPALVDRNNPDGRTVTSLENFIHPVDEDFEDVLNLGGFNVMNSICGSIRVLFRKAL